MITYLPIETSDVHATFAESGWVAHDFKAWLKTESDDGDFSHDILVEATFVHDAERAVGEAKRMSMLPPLDLRLDFNQSDIVPIRLSLGSARIAGDEILPFRFELPLYDVDFELDVNKMKLSVYSLGYSSGTHYERNAADGIFDERKALPVETVNRLQEGGELDVDLQVACHWKPKKYDDDMAAARAVVDGAVVPALNPSGDRQDATGEDRIDGKVNLVLDLRGSGGIPLGHQVFKFFPTVGIDDGRTLLGEPFRFQIEHGFELPIEMIPQATLTATIYGK